MEALDSVASKILSQFDDMNLLNKAKIYPVQLKEAKRRLDKATRERFEEALKVLETAGALIKEQDCYVRKMIPRV